MNTMERRTITGRVVALITCLVLALGLACAWTVYAQADDKNPAPKKVEEVAMYTITFKANGGSGSMGSQEVTAGAESKLDSNAFEREGYDFTGWNTDKDGDGTSYKDEASTANIKSNVTLYAQWKQQPVEEPDADEDSDENPEGNSSEDAEAGKKMSQQNAESTDTDGVNEGNGNNKSEGKTVETTSTANNTNARAAGTVVAGQEDKVTVAFDKNGGTGSMDPQEFEYGVEAKINANKFERSGYSFDGWNTKADGTGTAYNDQDAASFKEDATLYAQWKLIIVTVTFDKNGGTGSMDPQEFEYGVEAKINANKFTYKDHTFVGWNTKADGTGATYKDTASFKEDTTLYAQWSPVTVTFNAMGGETSTKSQNFNYDVEGKLKVEDPKREGHTFVGWNTKADRTGETFKNGQSVKLKKDMTLYAQWDPITVTFNAMGGESSTKSQDFNYDVERKLKVDDPTLKGHIFKGWFDQKNGKGTPYKNGQAVKLKQDMTLYAYWEPITVTVTFDKNGGSGSMDDQKFKYDVEDKLNANEFVREDRTFVGWNTKADGTGTPYTDKQSVKLQEDITLYAQWDPVIVTFNKNGGSGKMDNQEFTYGEEDKLNANKFTRSGYTFDGWSTKAKPDSDSTEYDDKATVSFKQDTTLYAQWKKNSSNSSSKSSTKSTSSKASPKTGDTVDVVPFVVVAAVAAAVVIFALVRKSRSKNDSSQE